MRFSRRQLLLAAPAVRLSASGRNFGDVKPPEEWDVMGAHGAPAAPIAGWGANAVVTWESAPPLRAALKTALPGAFDNGYVIGVDGVELGGEPAELVRRATPLRVKGKASAPIHRDLEEVVFATQFGRWQVEAHFRPKDMLYRGELAV